MRLSGVAWKTSIIGRRVRAEYAEGALKRWSVHQMLKAERPQLRIATPERGFRTIYLRGKDSHDKNEPGSRKLPKLR
jgi:hypothetical protein